MKPTPLAPFLLLLVLASPAIAQTPPWETGSYDPPWAGRAPSRTIRHRYDRGRSATENGAALAAAMSALRPGEALRIGPGTYSIERRLELSLAGTADRPIWIAAEGDEAPVVTRPDARQNLLDLGRAEYLVLRGLEFTGGSTAIRIHDGSNVWIDRCHIHRTGGEGITANTRDTHHLWITRNHIHDLATPSATCEGMYLGANDGKVRMSYSTIALNHVHDTGGTQGDGIEVKQGSHHNWIVENRVHDTRYPCVLVYGTAGEGVNVIERNVLVGSGDNVLQIQGEAIVRNNLIVGGRVGLASTDHQGKSRDLSVVHNTIVSRERATNLSSWNERPGMVFANNAIYSEGVALRFPNGSAGVVLAGNVVFGRVEGAADAGRPGRGLADFRDVTWDGSRLDATPARGSALIGSGEEVHHVRTDARGEAHRVRVAGAFAVRGG